MGLLNFMQKSALRKFARDDLSHAMKLPGYLQTQVADEVFKNFRDFMGDEPDAAQWQFKYQLIRHQRNNYGRNGPQSFQDPTWLTYALTEDITGAVLRDDKEIVMACLAWVDENRSKQS